MNPSIAPENDAVVRKLKEWDADAVAEVILFRDELTIVVPRQHLRRAAEFLHGDAELAFTYLCDVTGVDRFPTEPRFELNYHLVSMTQRRRLRLKVRAETANPVVETVSNVWPAAGWHEREVFDLFGVRFEGHTDLRRILMPVDWEGYPLRKDFPVEGFR